MIGNTQMQQAYNENVIISPSKIVMQSKQNKRTSSMKDGQQ
jgi:hypothetical protein